MSATVDLSAELSRKIDECTALFERLVGERAAVLYLRDRWPGPTYPVPVLRTEDAQALRQRAYDELAHEEAKGEK